MCILTWPACRHSSSVHGGDKPSHTQLQPNAYPGMIQDICYRIQATSLFRYNMRFCVCMISCSYTWVSQLRTTIIGVFEKWRFGARESKRECVCVELSLHPPCREHLRDRNCPLRWARGYRHVAWRNRWRNCLLFVSVLLGRRISSFTYSFQSSLRYGAKARSY